MTGGDIIERTDVLKVKAADPYLPVPASPLQSAFIQMVKASELEMADVSTIELVCDEPARSVCIET